MNKRICFVYKNDAHPFHFELMNSIGAESFKISVSRNGGISGKILESIKVFSIPREYDVYVFQELAETAFSFKILNPKKKVIVLRGSGAYTWYDLNNKIKLKGRSKLRILRKRLERKIGIWKLIFNKIDGFIFVGDLEKKFVELFANKPNIVVWPKSSDVFIKAANENKKPPNLNSHRLIQIAAVRDKGRYYYKGIDIAIEVFNKLKQKFNDLELYLVAVDKKFVYNEGIQTFSYLSGNDLIEKIKECSLYIHFARGEAAGISIQDAMLCGLPAMVSEYTGNKYFVEKVSKKLVVPLDIDEIVKRIEWYFNLPLEEKIKLSEKSVKLMEEQNKTAKERFINDFNKLVETLYKNK